MKRGWNRESDTKAETLRVHKNARN